MADEPYIDLITGKPIEPWAEEMMRRREERGTHPMTDPLALAKEALDPFARVYRINLPHGEGWSDDKPNSEFIPAAWPDWADFRKANEALAALAALSKWEAER